MFVTNWISTTKIQKISEITNFFRHYFLSRTEVLRWYFDMGEIIGLPIIYTYLYSKVRYPGFLTWIYIISLFASCWQFLASDNFEFGYHTIFR